MRRSLGREGPRFGVGGERCLGGGAGRRPWGRGSKGGMSHGDVLGRRGGTFGGRMVGDPGQGVPQEQSGRCPGWGGGRAGWGGARGEGSWQPLRVGEWSLLWSLSSPYSPAAGHRCALCCSAATWVPREGVTMPVVEFGAWLWQTSAVGPQAPQELGPPFSCGGIADRVQQSTCSGFMVEMKQFGS